MKRIISTVLAACLATCGSFGLTACVDDNATGSAQVVKLDPQNPTTVTLWHYYNGPQQDAFDSLVDEFNQTVGAESGIVVEATSHGSIADLQNDVIDAADKAVGAQELPDIFSTYNDVAAEVLKHTELANIADYFSGDELSQYVDAYIQDGYISSDDNLYVFPVAKSSEAFMLSKRDWDKFSKACDVELEQLSTIEGLTQVAQKYYEYTDSLTPNIKGDGKSFYGRDSLANYFLASFAQLGSPLVSVKGNSATLNTDKETYRRVWENFYVPYVNGYFTAKGKFRSDDVKTGDVIAYTGSTASASYFPTQIQEANKKARKTSAIVGAVPIMADGSNVVIQQGAGMAVTKSDELTQYAASIFIKWFTQPDANLRFVAQAGYLPVHKDANSVEALDATIKENNIEINETVYNTLKAFMENFDSTSFYSYPSFANATALRDVLDASLAQTAAADKEAIDKKVAKGAKKEKVIASYTSGKSFDKWYDNLVKELQDTLDAQ